MIEKPLAQLVTDAMFDAGLIPTMPRDYLIPPFNADSIHDHVYGGDE